MGAAPEPDGWIEAARVADVPVGRAVKATVGDADLLLYRTDDRVFAVSNRCTHQGAPLHRGTVRASGSIVSATCPLHGSTFQLTDGRVLRGPAMRPLPIYEARVAGEAVEVRLLP
ncbi:MAG TPA: Rieske (2Fe-2S) protein [Actinomycetota bacterium]